MVAVIAQVWRYGSNYSTDRYINITVQIASGFPSRNQALDVAHAGREQNVEFLQVNLTSLVTSKSHLERWNTAGI